MVFWPELPLRAVTWARNRLFDTGLLRQAKAGLPVISIGNLTTGGNGKTPFTLLVAEGLKKLGCKPVILSRGYGGSCRGPLLVGASATPVEVGDEPILLSQRSGCPVVISRSRVAGAHFIHSRSLGEVIVLDDGFQHRYLARDLNLVLIDVSDQLECDRFIKGQLLPVGSFREDRDDALKRADSIVLVCRRVVEDFPAPPGELLSLLPPNLPLFTSWPSTVAIYRAVNREPLPKESYSQQQVVAICGIAKPQAFYDSLTALGFTLVGQHSFRDHGEIPYELLAQIARTKPEIPIVCTEKDLVKLDLTRVPENLYVVALKTTVEPSLQFQELLRVVASHRTGG